MNKKQINKLAQQIIELELIHQNPSATKEEKAKAENRILQLSGMLGCLPNGIEIMGEIDLKVQKALAEQEN